MSINTHVRYSMCCDKCGSFYWPNNNRENEQLACASLLRFLAKQDGWVIHEHDSKLDCYCPDCCRKEQQK